jgi:Ricin-type beta-trefoil lectin domain-like
MGVDVQVGAGGFSVGLSEKALRSLKERFSRRSLYGGPCMLIERHSGLALDSTTSPRHLCRPVLWTPHGLQWQQWRFRRSGRNLFKIVSEMNGMVLTTDAAAHDRSWVWLESDRDRDDQRWRLLPSEDRAAFVVESMRSEHCLDGTRDPKLPAATEDRSVSEPTSPLMWTTNWPAWQQWMIVRLPFT